MSGGVAPGLEELQQILADGLAAVTEAIEARDAAPAPPASIEEAEAKLAEEAAIAAKARVDGLIAEGRALDEAYASASGAVSVEELRRTDERRGTLQYDLWEARVSVEKSAIVMDEKRLAALRADGLATLPGQRVVAKVLEEVGAYANRLGRYRAGRDVRHSGLPSMIGEARVRLDGLLAAPPSQSARGKVRNR